MYKEELKANCPEGWEVSTIGECCEVRNNLRKPISVEERKKIQGKYPYYGPTKILDNINEFRIEGKHVLLSEDGDHFLKFNTMPMTLLVDGKYNVNNHAHILRGIEYCITDWIYHFFSHTNFYKHITRQGAGRFKLSKESLLKIGLLLPKVKEQKMISSILFTWAKAIDQTDRLIKSKEKQKKALMQQLLTGKKRLKAYQDEKWLEFQLWGVFTERKETNYSKLPLLSITAGRGVINRDELVKKDTSNADKSKYKRIMPGDIGYNTMRMWQGVSGVSDLEGIVSPAYTICIPKENIDSKFAGYLFKYKPIINLFYRYSQGLVNDTLSLKFNSFSQIKVKLPSIKEQKHIAKILNTADKELNILEQKRNVLQQQKKGLMQKLLTGKIRVKV